MNMPTLSRPDLALCKSCLDKIDRSRGSLEYVRVLGGDIAEPANNLAGMRQAILGVLELSQKTEQDLSMLEVPDGSLS